VGSELGISDEKILALPDYAESALFDQLEKTVLEYADAMTITGRDVGDELFARIRAYFDEDAIVELTALIAFENCSSKFNRALRVPSQGLWKRRDGPETSSK
jgi:alkylhydroperoxidase family enzyme